MLIATSFIEALRRPFESALFTPPGIAEFISGVILQDETIRQQSSTGVPLARYSAKERILPGIKVDTGAKRSRGLLTKGDRRARRSARAPGRVPQSWRAIREVASGHPHRGCPAEPRSLAANAHALARYAALCQEQGLVPIVEPEVLMNGRTLSSAARRHRHGAACRV